MNLEEQYHAAAMLRIAESDGRRIAELAEPPHPGAHAPRCGRHPQGLMHRCRACMYWCPANAEVRGD